MSFVFISKPRSQAAMLPLCMLLLLLTAPALPDRCSRALQVSVSSRRNQTGHWHTHILWDHEASASEMDNKETAPVSLKMSQRVRGCSGAETLSMEATVTAPPPPAGPGYVLLPDMGRYKFHTAPAIWEAARQTCSGEGGHLAVIRSKPQEDALKEMFARHPKIPNSTWDGAAWLGLHDQHNEADFLSVLGESLQRIGYANWEAGKPDNKVYGGRPIDSDCVGILRKGNLIDLPCDAKYAFICEQELW